MDREPDEKEKAQVRRLLERVEKARLRPRRKKYEEEIKRSRALLAGKRKTEDGEQQDVPANVIYSTIRTILPRIYAKEPAIAVNVSRTVRATQDGTSVRGQTGYSWVRPFAETAEILIQRQLADAGLKAKGKALTLGAMCCSMGWLKCTYQRDYSKDPIIQHRIPDSQDNLARVQAAISKLEDGEQGREELLEQEARLNDQIAALERQAEVSAAQGLALDYVFAEDIVTDPMVRDATDYASGRWIAQRILYDQEEFEAVFGCEADKKATRYNHDQEAADGELLAVWEIWDKDAQQRYTVCEGMDKHIREPITPTRGGERFYPFFALAFNPVDGTPYPLSDVLLLERLQREWTETRERQERHRAMSIPGWWGDSEAFEKGAIKSLTHQVLGEVALINTSGKLLSDSIMERRNPSYNPLIYDTTPIRTDLELVSGAGDAARGAVTKAKTATEAAYLEEGLASRTDERRDVIEDLIQELAQYSLEVLLQEMAPEHVRRVVGDNAIWPELSKDDVMSLVTVEVQAGTAGKPNKYRDQEQWVKLMEPLQTLILQINEAESQGNQGVADALRELLSMMLQRFDERIDLDALLPKTQPGMPGQPMLGQPNIPQMPNPPAF